MVHYIDLAESGSEMGWWGQKNPLMSRALACLHACACDFLVIVYYLNHQHESKENQRFQAICYGFNAVDQHFNDAEGRFFRGGEGVEIGKTPDRYLLIQSAKNFQQ
jgi:hypothetical protein